jgi:hypothetical protein
LGKEQDGKYIYNLAMIMKNTIIYLNFLLLGLGMSILNAQVIVQPKPVEYDLKGVVYATETIYEVRPHLQGITFAYKKGTLKNYYETTYFGYEFGYMKDARERKQTKSEPRLEDLSRSSFVYGKRSSFYNLRFTYGKKKFLSEKTKRKGVAMGFIYEGGASIGLIKPYYLNVIRLDDDLVTRIVEEVKYNDDTSDDFLNFENIYGGSNFWKGILETTPTVGLHGKAGMQWALGAFDQKAKAIEIGAMLDLYPREIPLMVEREGINNSFFLFKFYASFQFGQRRL